MTDVFDNVLRLALLEILIDCKVHKAKQNGPESAAKSSFAGMAESSLIKPKGWHDRHFGCRQCPEQWNTALLFELQSFRFDLNLVDQKVSLMLDWLTMILKRGESF